MVSKKEICALLFRRDWNVGYCTSVAKKALPTCENQDAQAVKEKNISKVPLHNISSAYLTSESSSVLNKEEQSSVSDKALFVSRSGKLMKSMLHKTYWNLKDRNLIQMKHEDFEEEMKTPHSSVCIPDLSKLESTFYPAKRSFSYCETDYVNMRTDKANEKELNSRELFFQKMQLKYQDPSAKILHVLGKRYPHPESLFAEVVTPLLEAQGQEKTDPVVTSHLRQVYWKASLAVPWSHTITTTHPHKDQAVRGVFLKACQQLERLGLIWLDSAGDWRATDCKQVLSMLDTLGKYVEASLASARGRGFKIILSQTANDTFTSKDSNSDRNPPKSDPADQIFLNDCETETSGRHNVCSSSNLNDSSSSSSIGIVCNGSGFPKDVSPPVRSLAPWECTIHVGWPFPFTVQCHGVSLPAAQLLGLMKVATKLKSQGLLTCHGGTLSVSPQVLGRLVRIDVQGHWEKCLVSAKDSSILAKFSSNAELFCDASVKGFGAYLVLKDFGKVSWLCEVWEEHSPAFQALLRPRRRMFESTLAEVYATVTSICSWKKKLRGKSLISYSDNQTTVALINSYLENPIPPDRCVTPLDCLISSLHAACKTYSIRLCAAWLCRDHNSLADLLSRRNTKRFHTFVPQATGNKTKAIKLSIPWHKYA